MTAQREPQVPVEYGVRAVSPCTSLTRRGAMPSISLAICAKRGFQALAVALHADAQFEAAVGGEPRSGLLEAGHHGNSPAGVDRGAVRALLAEDRQADADLATIGFALRLARAHRGQVDRRHRAVQAFDVVAAVEYLVGDVDEGHLLRPH